MDRSQDCMCSFLPKSTLSSAKCRAAANTPGEQGSRPLHQAYYFYEELYQLPAGRTPPVLASHAAAHLLLSHVDEAKADITEALTQGSDADVLAVAASLGMPDSLQYVPSPCPPPS